MIKWEGLRLWVFREDGRNIVVAARGLTEARKISGTKTVDFDHIECTLLVSEGVFAERKDVNEGQEP